ncbi:type IV pilus assembly protein PilM [Candidatus Woesebacteria bacterium]|nr:type IV pilus assembly protein PilM [Candidatus Woesebacteria bacterium]
MTVGLDIGSRTIKIVELSKEGESFKLRGSGIIGYAGTSLEHLSEDKDLAIVAEIVKKLHKEARISSHDAAIALPEQSVFTRTIKFPPLTDSEIESAIKWEAEQYIPIPAADAVIRHQIIERKENVRPPEVDVLLVAAPRSLVEKYTRVVQIAGLNPIYVETELLALVRALAPLSGVVMLIDLGAKSTDIAISKNGLLSFSRSIPTAGEAFTRAIVQNLGVESPQAEEYKKTYGLSGNQLEGKIKGAIDPIFRVVADEIKKAIHYYQTEDKGEAPTSIILSGGTAGMPEAATFMTKILGLEVVIGNPFSKIAVDPGVSQAVQAYAPLYAIAAGLAERV